MTSLLNPRMLASGVKAISAALAPPRVSHANKPDQTLDEWEDRLVKLETEYGRELTAKVKMPVLYGMVPKDSQDKDETTESEAGRLHTKIKAQLRNIAKARREMAGPKPMEGSEGYAQYIEKRGGKKGAKVLKDIATWDCYKGKGKGKGFQQGQWQRLRQGWTRRQGVRQRKGRRWQGRHAEGLLSVWVYGAHHQGLPEQHERPASRGGHPRDSLHRQRVEQWKKMPMKVTLGDS